MGRGEEEDIIYNIKHYGRWFLFCCPSCMASNWLHELGELNMPDIVLGVPRGGVCRAATPSLMESTSSDEEIVTVEEEEFVRLVWG